MKSNKDPAHQLIPSELESKLPPLYATEHLEDPVAHLKWFTPDSNWTWYVLEYDPTERVAFGLVSGHELELGYFSVREIEEARGPWGLRVERDLSFEPTHLSELRRQHSRDFDIERER